MTEVKERARKRRSKRDDDARDDDAAGCIAQEKFEMHVDAALSELRIGGREYALFGKTLYVYRDGYWSIAADYDEMLIQRALANASHKSNVAYGSYSSAINTVLKTRIPIADQSSLDESSPWFAMPDGQSVDLATGLTKPWNKEDYLTKALPFVHDPDATCPEWEAMLRRIVKDKDRTPEDEEKLIAFLQEWFGINLVGGSARNARALKKGLIVDGPSGTGKTTIADIFRLLVGESFACPIAIDGLSENYALETLLGKRAIISDDGIGTDSKGDARTLKKIVTGEPMHVPRKYKGAVQLRFTGACLFTTNTLPHIADESNAIYDRFLIVRLTKVFTSDEAAKHFAPYENGKDFLVAKGELPGILAWAVRGYHRAKARKCFELPREIVNAAIALRARNDLAYGILLEFCEYDPDVTNSIKTLAAIGHEYVEQQYYARRATQKGLEDKIKRAVGDVFRDVKLEGDQLVGLRIVPSALMYLERKVEKGSIEKGTKLNAKRV